MPKSRFQCEIIADTQAILDAAKAAVVAQLPNPSRFLDTLIDWIQTVTEGRLRLVFQCRFKATSDLDTLWPKLLALNVNNVNGYFSRHECSHDDPEIYNCRRDVRAAYQERVF